MAEPLHPASPNALPKELATQAAELFGRLHVVRWSEELLAGRVDAGDPEWPDIAWLAGRSAGRATGAGCGAPGGCCTSARRSAPRIVLGALADESWRVREMSLRVVRRHGLEDPDGMIDRLVDDPVERVRVQAWTTLGWNPDAYESAHTPDRKHRHDRRRAPATLAARSTGRADMWTPTLAPRYRDAGRYGVDADVLVIGAGPAGLAAAACLRRRGIDTVVVDRGDAVGDSWRARYARLHLHTPRVQSALPGLRMPPEYGRWVAKDDVADVPRSLRAASRDRAAVPLRGAGTRTADRMLGCNHARW